MYAIMSEGALVALCDKPRYIKRNENGIYVEAAPEEAIAVSVNGDLYNINGGSAIPEAPEAVVGERDASEFVFDNRVRIVENEKAAETALSGMEDADAMNVDHEYRLALLELGLREEV